MLAQFKSYLVLTKNYISFLFNSWTKIFQMLLTCFLFVTIHDISSNIGTAYTFYTFLIAPVIDVCLNAFYSKQTKDFIVLLSLYTVSFIKTTFLVCLLIVSNYLTKGVVVKSSAELFYLLFLSSVIISSIGIRDAININNIKETKWGMSFLDICFCVHFLSHFIFIPLSFLFSYSFPELFTSWSIGAKLFNTINSFNPINHIVNMFRYYYIGKADFVPNPSSLTLLTCIAIFFCVSTTLSFIKNKHERRSNITKM